MDSLEVQNLVKRVNADLTIDQVSFSVKDNEFFVLLGQSGSGKSSILRLICGFEQADGGTILINGQDVTNTPPHLRNVAVVFQDYALFPTMNVFDNIAYGLSIRRLPRSEIEMRILMAAKTLDIEPLLMRSLANLSGGELQRVALARVMVTNADLYLFDEPLSQLDPRTRHQVRQEIMMVHHIKRKPSIYITHDQDEAFAMASFIAVISKGRVQQIGTADELMNRPANLFVARFIGHPPINLIDGMLQFIATHYEVRCDGFYYTLHTDWTSILAHLGPQARVIIGIKPNIIIPEWSFTTLGTPAHVIIPAQVSKVEHSIGEILVTLKIGFSTEIVATFDDTSAGPLALGQFINIALDLSRLYLFNPQTGQLLNR